MTDEPGSDRTEPSDPPRRASMADARRGTRFGAANLLVTQVGSIITTVVLARLLTPADFGIVALAQSLLAAAVIFAISGVRAALLTRLDSVAEAADTLFWTTLIFGLIVWTVLATLAVPLTRFFGQPDVAPYVIVLATSVVGGLTSGVPLGLLQRALRFRAYYFSLLAGSFAYFVCELALALLGYGAWSVIIGLVVGNFATLLLSMILARWLPRPRVSRRILREDASFLGAETLNGGLNYFQGNVDYWAVSRILGGPLLGIYYISYVLPSIVRLRLTTITNTVLLPAFASVRNEQERLERTWQRSWLMQAGLGIPMLIGIASLAGPIIEVFFGSQWSSAVVPMQILTIVALIDVHMTTVSVLAAARRRVTWNTIVVAARAVLTTVCAFGAARVYGTLPAVAWGVAAAALLTLAVQESTASRHLGVGLRFIVRPLVIYLALGGVMSLSVSLFLALTPTWNPVIQLILGIALGASMYLGIGTVLAGSYIRPLIREARALTLGR